MIKVIPFHPKHMVDLPVLLGCYEGDFDLPNRITALFGVPGSLMHTLMNGEQPIAVVGGVLNKHILTIWAAASEAVKEHGFGYHRAVLRLLGNTVRETGVKRVQSLVNANNEAAIAQHRAMGFECEGLLKMSGPNMQDEFLFARIYDGR